MGLWNNGAVGQWDSVTVGQLDSGQRSGLDSKSGSTGWHWTHRYEEDGGVKEHEGSQTTILGY